MPLISDEQRRAILLWTGVKLSKDGKAIFNYNPAHFQAGVNFLLAWGLLPGFINRAHILQLLGLFGVMHFYIWVLSDATDVGSGKVDTTIIWCYENIAGLSRFVLGLFVSLVLSRTYYANRGVFGTVFGCSMGLTEQVVAWVRPPAASARDHGAKDSARKAQELLVRWINAAFRLMWLECVPDLSTQDIAKDILEAKLLTEKEWKKIESLSSRCTHIYQWISNVLMDLLERGYIYSSNQLVSMTKNVDDMRGANVWGLPSLPIAYTQIITHMVKMHILLLALRCAVLASEQIHIGQASGWDRPTILIIVAAHGDLVTHHYLWQGLLDLHGAVYNPNSGTLLGHMPSLNFMSFVRDVTEHLVSENDTPPYDLDLAIGGGSLENSDPQIYKVKAV